MTYTLYTDIPQKWAGLLPIVPLCPSLLNFATISSGSQQTKPHHPLLCIIITHTNIFALQKHERLYSLVMLLNRPFFSYTFDIQIPTFPYILCDVILLQVDPHLQEW